MNKKSKLIIILTTAMIFLASCGTTPTPVQLSNPQTTAIQQTESSQIEASQHTAVTLRSCAQPTPELAPHCLQVEQAILAATVRLELFRWSDADGRQGEYIAGGNSHATIKDGRYLVTHNHFGELLLALQNQGIPGEYIRLAIYQTNGELILSNIPLTDLTVMVEDPQTLVLAFRDEGNLGFFEIRGLPSAKFAAWQNLPLQPGTEVAQINWDGQTSHVNWTTIEHVTNENDTPQITVASYVERGASGGGIFLHGVHIGNNWLRAREQNQETSELLLQYSMGALNSVEVTAVVQTMPNSSQKITISDDSETRIDTTAEFGQRIY